MLVLFLVEHYFRQGDAVIDVKLGVNVLQGFFHSGFRDEQSGGDPLVGQAGRKQFRNFLFPGSEQVIETVIRTQTVTEAGDACAIFCVQLQNLANEGRIRICR